MPTRRKPAPKKTRTTTATQITELMDRVAELDAELYDYKIRTVENESDLLNLAERVNGLRTLVEPVVYYNDQRVRKSNARKNAIAEIVPPAMFVLSVALIFGVGVLVGVTW